MASDRNLINAAFAESQSRYAGNVPNMSSVYQSTRDISKQYLDLVGGIMADIRAERELLKKQQEQQKNNFMAMADRNLTSLYIDEEPLPEPFIDLAETAVQDMAARYDLVNTIGDNDTKENRRARRQITAELTVFTNKLKNARTMFMDRSDVIQKDLANKRIYNYEDINLAAIAFDLDNIDDNVKNGTIKLGYDKKGIFFQVFDGTIYKRLELKEIESLFAPVNPDLATNYYNIVTKTGKRGLIDGSDPDANFNYNEDDFLAKFKSDVIVTKSDFDDFAYQSISQLNDEPSFEDSVYENAEQMGIPVAILDQIVITENNTMQQVGEEYKKLDLVPDGVINSLDGAKAAEQLQGQELKDYKENVKQLIDAIVNINNPAFNFEVSRDLMAKYYMTFDKRNYTINFNNERDKLEQRNLRNRVESPNYLIGNREMTSETFDANYGYFINQLENPTEGSVISSPAGFNYEYKDGKFYSEGENSDFSTEISIKQIGDRDRITQFIRFPRGIYHTTGTRRYKAIDYNMYETIGNTNVRVEQLGEVSVDKAAELINKAYGTNTFSVEGKQLKHGKQTFSTSGKSGLQRLWKYLLSDDFHNNL